MAMARRVSLFERQVIVKLSPLAVDILLGAGRVLTEGDVAHGSYQGSTMVTIDLARTALYVSDPLDAATAARVAALVPDDDRARHKVRGLAITEANRHAGERLTEPTVDVRARANGRAVHLDLNLEAKVRSTGDVPVPSASGKPEAFTPPRVPRADTRRTA